MKKPPYEYTSEVYDAFIERARAERAAAVADAVRRLPGLVRHLWSVPGNRRP